MTTAPPKARGPAARGGLPYEELFERSPSGMIVTHPTGEIVAVNQTAQRMLGKAARQPNVRCCDLLGCGTIGTVLAEGCVSALAAREAGAFHEVRVDLPRPAAGSQVEAVWVTGAPIDSASDLVLLGLRPGAVGDRRRRTEPHWISGPRLSIDVLGSPSVSSAEGSLNGPWLGHRPGELLKYLVVHRARVVSLDELLEVFPAKNNRPSPGAIRQAVHLLRGRLDPVRRPHGPSPFILARKDGYELNMANISIDVDAFERCLGAAIRARSLGRPTAEVQQLTSAVGLYRGELMSDEPYSEWVLAERDRLRRLAIQALRALARIHLEGGDLESASELLVRAAELEPLDIEIQKELLAVMRRQGRDVEAARRLELIRGRYLRVLGEDPRLDLAATRPASPSRREASGVGG